MPVTSSIHIAFNIDQNYVRFCAVTMASIFENNKEEHIVAHIIQDGLNEHDKQELKSLAAQYGNEVLFYTPDPKVLEGFTIRKFKKRITLATYYRCLISEILPQDIDKVIYLDCDILVLGKIRPFYDVDLGENGVGVVDDMGSDDDIRYEILRYPKECSYFNAGVLLINLSYWRAHKISEQCVDYYHKNHDRILFNDQDILNALFYNKKTTLPYKWNMQDAFYRTKSPKQFTNDELLHPVILHFTNRKPWDYDNQHPLKDLFFHYQNLTSWKGMHPMKNVINVFKRFFRLLPFHLGFRAPKYKRF